jgi:alpha-galactosidase
VDACRIGPDSAPTWSAVHPCTILEAIRSLGLNAWANKLLFANDPDVTYARARGDFDPIGGNSETFKSKLSLAELQTWHSFVGLLGGMVLFSDPVQKSEYHEASALRMLEILHPPAPDLGRSIHPGTDRNHTRFGFAAERIWGNFASVLVWNSAEEPSTVALKTSKLDCLGKQFHAWSFWDERYIGIVNHGYITEKLEPHACALLRLTEAAEFGNKPILIGSTLHISMGSAEITNILIQEKSMIIQLTDAGAQEGKLFIFSKQPLEVISSTGCKVKSLCKRDNDDVWSLELVHRVKGAAQSCELIIR